MALDLPLRDIDLGRAWLADHSGTQAPDSLIERKSNVANATLMVAIDYQ